MSLLHIELQYHQLFDNRLLILIFALIQVQRVVVAENQLKSTPNELCTAYMAMHV